MYKYTKYEIGAISDKMGLPGFEPGANKSDSKLFDCLT